MTAGAAPPPPWGAYAPQGAARRVLALCQALPAGRLWAYRLIRGVRSIMKRGPLRYYDVECAGLRLRLQNQGNHTDVRLLFSPQFYDLEELDWLRDELAEGGTFLDIGGNIGAYSLIVARRLGRERVTVHTVEPDPVLCERLLFNARANDVELTLHRTALSDYEGRGGISVSLHQRGENRLESRGASAAEEVEVVVTTLASLCREAGIEAIRAMKIDIEGHEHRVLDAFFAEAPSSLWPVAIVIEHIDDRHRLIDRLVDQRGYRLVARTKRNALLKREIARA